MLLATAALSSDIIPNSNFEKIDSNGWAEGWPRTAFMSYEQEGANHFLRMNALSPNKMHMLYREIKVPTGAEALELTWRHRISNLKKGEKSWFDARIMLEFMDGNRKGLPAKPKAPSFGKNVAEWTECKTQFLVPKDAKILKLMPALFNVESGTWDIDDMQIKPISANELKAAEAKHKEQYNKAKAAESEKIRNKAAQTLANGGSLIANGSFEELREDGMGAKHWGSNNENTFVASEAGNHFMRITAKPNKLVNIYREYPIPTGAKALELSWRQRVTGLKTGEKPWFDARFIFELKDASRNKIAGAPGPAYTQKDTSGWVTKSTRFLVPDNATYFVFMPCLFEAKAGTFDIDDLVLKPIDPAPIIVEKKKWERIEAMRKAVGLPGNVAAIALHDVRSPGGISYRKIGCGCQIQQSIWMELRDITFEVYILQVFAVVEHMLVQVSYTGRDREGGQRKAALECAFANGFYTGRDVNICQRTTAPERHSCNLSSSL